MSKPRLSTNTPWQVAKCEIMTRDSVTEYLGQDVREYVLNAGHSVECPNTLAGSRIGVPTDKGLDKEHRYCWERLGIVCTSSSFSRDEERCIREAGRPVCGEPIRDIERSSIGRDRFGLIRLFVSE